MPTSYRQRVFHSVKIVGGCQGVCHVAILACGQDGLELPSLGEHCSHQVIRTGMLMVDVTPLQKLGNSTSIKRLKVCLTHCSAKSSPPQSRSEVPMHPYSDDLAPYLRRDLA